MLGPTHRILGALAGVSAAQLADQSWEMMAMSGLVASATSHGWASPDVDQTAPWVWVRRRLGGPDWLNHRELSHWWGLPVLATWWVTTLPAEAIWPATMLLVGWASHVVGDAVFGKVPFWPGSRTRLGLGLDTGGFVETGRVELRGRSRTLIPFGPARVLIAGLIGWVLVS